MAEQSVLLSHLLNDKSTAPLSAVQATLSQHLAHIQPLPTPLAAAAVSSPLYSSRPHTHDKLQSLATAFHNAGHLKFQAVEKAFESQSIVASLFTRDAQSTIAQWAIDIVRGLQGGQAIMRLTCLTGLLLGIEDIGKTKRDGGQVFNTGRGRNVVENELVIAVAEILDAYGYEPKSDWEREFRPAVADGALSLSLVLASQCLPFVSTTRLRTLPLSVLNGMLMSTISQAFQSGLFLSTLNKSVSSSDHALRIHDTYGQHLKVMTSSPAYMSIASLSKITALTLEIVLDTRSRRIQQAMETAMGALSSFRQLARIIEVDWSSSLLPGKKEDDIESSSRAISKDIWSILKTFLFSMVMVAQAPLTTVVYAPQHLFLPSLRPHHLTLEVLHTLYHLSFIISEFGGISPESNTFTELKRVTYLALDILIQEPKEAEAFVTHICSSVGVVGDGQRQIIDMNNQILASKKAFALVCLEQLVPILSVQRIRGWVWEMCYTHLSDSSHRDIYESAHSVILAILASPVNAENKDLSSVVRDKVNSHSEASEDFVTRIIPFYAECLIENSGDGKLSTAQLRLAYSALVQSAASHSNAHDAFDSTTLAWYCIETLIDAIYEVSHDKDSSKAGDAGKVALNTAPPTTESHSHCLHLTLIASVPSLPLPLMLRVLDRIRDIILGKDVSSHRHTEYRLRSEVASFGNGSSITLERKAELVDALFREILERVGDQEKEAAMGWWYANLEELKGAVRGGDGMQHSSSDTVVDQGDLTSAV